MLSCAWLWRGHSLGAACSGQGGSFAWSTGSHADHASTPPPHLGAPQSGRLTFFFRKRQDLLAWAVSGITRSPDVLDIQIDLSPGSIPPLVLLIARAGHAKTLAKEQADVKVRRSMLRAAFSYGGGGGRVICEFIS